MAPLNFKAPCQCTVLSPVCQILAKLALPEVTGIRRELCACHVLGTEHNYLANPLKLKPAIIHLLVVLVIWWTTSTMKSHLNFTISSPTDLSEWLTSSANKSLCDTSVWYIISFSLASLLQRNDQKLDTKMKNRRGRTKYGSFWFSNNWCLVVLQEQVTQTFMDIFFSCTYTSLSYLYQREYFGVY